MSDLSLSIVIQAGGQSQRMGQDKALARFLEHTLIERVIERLRPLEADEVIITTNQPQGYQFLGLPLVSDRLPGAGALGGLYTALSAASQPLVVVVACDMPFVNAALLGALAKRASEAEWDAAVPRSEGGLEPFHAVYSKDACLPLVETALLAEKRRVDAWFARARIYLAPLEETRPYDPQGLAFANVNTPDELSAAEALARKLESTDEENDAGSSIS